MQSGNVGFQTAAALWEHLQSSAGQGANGQGERKESEGRRKKDEVGADPEWSPQVNCTGFSMWVSSHLREFGFLIRVLVRGWITLIKPHCFHLNVNIPFIYCM